MIVLRCLLLLLVLNFGCFGNDFVYPFTAKDAPVKNLNSKIPYSKKKLRNYIWDTFVKDRKKDFSYYSTKDWEKNYDTFAEQIISKALSLGLKTDGLEMVLKKTKPPKEARLARLPVSAYFAQRGSRGVWIVIHQWEYIRYKETESMLDRDYPNLTHARISVYDSESSEYIVSKSCM